MKQIIIEWLITVSLILVGVFDLYRLVSKKDTISQKVHRWFSGKLQWIDYAILIAILILIWWAFGQLTFNRIMIGTVLGHLLWNKD